MYYNEEELKKERQAQLDAALRDGKKDGFAEGLAEGLEKGLEKGLAEGEARKARETAMKMLERDVPLDDISEFTGLSVEEIQAL